MSVTGHNPVRHKDDFYATPAWCTQAILPHLVRLGLHQPPGGEGDVIVDPCCGDGAILDVVASVWPKATRFGIELDDGRCHVASKRHRVALGDALSQSPWPGPGWSKKPRLVLTNPPYSLAMQFVERALSEVAPGGTVAMLLRLGWLASLERSAWMQRNTPSVYVLPRRPSFAAALRCEKKCGFTLLLPLEAPRPKACPTCGNKVIVSVTDSADYAWFVWDGRRPSVTILHVDEAA